MMMLNNLLLLTTLIFIILAPMAITSTTPTPPIAKPTTIANHLQAIPAADTMGEMVLLTDWQTGTRVSQASKVNQNSAMFEIQTHQRIFK